MENTTITNPGEHKVRNGKSLIILVVILVVAAVAIGLVKFAKQAEGCRPGDEFSQTTGKPCPGKRGETPEPCKKGDIYNINTGEPCAVE